MAVNLAGVIVVGVLIVVLSILAWAFMVSTTTVGFSAMRANELTGEQARTKLEFVSVQGGAADLTLKVKNTGLTSVFDFANMDVIVEYLDASGNQVSTRLTYTTGVLANNQWQKTSISPDTYQPNAWNPNETITLDALLSPAQKTDSTATVAVVTPNGVAAVWTFGPSGFFWFVNAPDISLITAGSWQDIDLSAHVPQGTTGAVVEIINTDTSNHNGVVRGKEDTRDYLSNSQYQRVESETHRWQIVKVDGNRVIQGYIETTQIDFKLLGYTMGTDPLFFNTPLDVTPATENAWTTADVSAFVDAGADGVILFIVSTQDLNRNYAVREVGSSFNTTNRNLENFSSTMYLVGIDGNDQFQVYHEDFDDTKFYVVAQTKGSVVYYVNDLAVADPSTGSWQEIDADTYAVPAAANGLIFRIENRDGSDRIAGIRHGDSTDAWTPDVGDGNHIEAAIGINDSNVWDEYIEVVNLDFYIAAYTRTIAN